MADATARPTEPLILTPGEANAKLMSLFLAGRQPPIPVPLPDFDPLVRTLNSFPPAEPTGPPDELRRGAPLLPPGHIPPALRDPGIFGAGGAQSAGDPVLSPQQPVPTDFSRDRFGRGNPMTPSEYHNVALSPLKRAADTQSAAGSDDLSSVLPQITTQYPRLADVLRGASLQYGPPEARGGFLETYPAWEERNPTPGRPNITVFDRSLNPVSDFIAADALHFLGSVDSRTGQQIDPGWAALKQRFAGSMTPEQQAMNQRAFQMDRARDPTEARSFDDWMQQSRLDAYLRGGLFPQINPEWQRPDIFSPDQQMMLQQMRQLLQTPPGVDPMVHYIMQQRGIDPAMLQLLGR